MMRFEDKVKYLSIALVALLLVWGLGEFFAPERSSVRSETSSLLAGKGSEVARIELSAKTGQLTLVKEGGRWVLKDGQDSLPVLSSRVDALLSALGKAGRRRPVASGKDAWKNLGLEDQSSKALKVSDASGKVLVDLKLGNSGSTGAEVYARFGGSDASFTIDAGLGSYLNPDRGSWLDRRLFTSSADSNAVQSFAVKADLTLEGANGKALRFAWKFLRSGQDWKGGARELDSVSIESALRAALNLEAVDLAARAGVGAFDKIGATISFDLGSGKTRMVEIGSPAGDGRFWARASEGDQASPLAFQVSSYSLGNFIKDENAYVKK